MVRSGWWRIAPAVALVMALAAPAATRAANVDGVVLHLPDIAGYTLSGAVHDADGAPLAGASVGVCEAPLGCFDVSALSAADGSFTVHGVRAGTWYVAARPPDGTNLLPAYRGAGGVSTPDAAAAVAVEISADMSGLAFVLDEGLRITGRVLGPDGHPVAGVRVFASGDSAPRSAGVSADDGSYAAMGLLAGVPYRLEALPPAGSPFLGGYVEAGTVQVEDSSTTYTPGPADVTGADITLIRGRSISGQLTGVGGDVVKVRADGELGSHSVPVAGDGTFSVLPLWPGTYTLTFQAPEGETESQFPYGVYNGDGEVLVSQYEPGVPVDVTAGDVGGLTAVLPVLPSISGTISDASGPVAGARVGFCEPDLGCGHTVVDGAGHYTFINVPPGAYAIRAGAAGHVLMWHGAAGSVADEALSAPVTVAASSLTGIDLVLSTGFSISGTVLNDAGQPVVGAFALAVGADRGINEFGPGGVNTDAAGHFTLRGLKEGDYYLDASGPEGSAYGFTYWSIGSPTADIDKAVMLHVGAGDTAPRVGFRTGRQLSTTRVPVIVSWPSAGTNVKAYGLQQQANGGAWTTVDSFTTASSEGTFAPSGTTTHRFRVVARYKDLTSTLWGVGPAFRVLLSQQSTSAVAWHGTWKTVKATAASGGSYKVASKRGASVTYTFTGRAVAWVAMRGKGFGKAAVSVDGAKPVTVDLRSGSTQSRRIVFSKSWAASARHTVKVTCLATAGHPRVDVDAFTVVR
jgi:protocatechuate 3,4-dioxygenase beta subunit